MPARPRLHSPSTMPPLPLPRPQRRSRTRALLGHVPRRQGLGVRLTPPHAAAAGTCVAPSSRSIGRTLRSSTGFTTALGPPMWRTTSTARSRTTTPARPPTPSPRPSPRLTCLSPLRSTALCGVSAATASPCGGALPRMAASSLYRMRAGRASEASPELYADLSGIVLAKGCNAQRSRGARAPRGRCGMPHAPAWSADLPIAAIWMDAKRSALWTTHAVRQIAGADSDSPTL